MAEEKDIALLADNDIIVEIEVQEAPTVVIDTTSTTTAEISGDSALGIVVGAIPTLAKEATLLAKVAELKEALNTIDFTAIEQAIQDVEDVTAKEATLIQGVGDIIKAVENIDFTDLENSIAEVKNAVANIDFSALAKEDTLSQGISTLSQKIDDIPATDLSPVAKEQTLLDKAEEIKQAVENAKPEIDLSSVESKVEEESAAIREKIDNIKLPEIDTTNIQDKLQHIIDANILEPNLQGITFVDGEATNDVAALIVSGASAIVSIGSETMNKAIRQYTFNACSNLREVNFPLATSIGISAFQSCSNLREVNFPLATSIGTQAFQSCSNLREVNFPLATSIGTYTFNACSNLREVNFPLATSIGTQAFNACTNLIKLTLGVNLANSINLSSALWNPTNAYSTTSRSLVPEDIQAEHPLWYNLDYLLYNIRECIAVNLPDRTGQSALTITFNATMKGHINNSEETVEAFTSKNWTIA